MDGLFASEELTGEVVGVYYSDTATGFGVVELLEAGARKGRGEGTRCSGPLSALVEGQTVRLVGQLREHPQYGPTFETTYYEQVVPTTVSGMRSFLASDRFDGVPPEAIDRALITFGKATGSVIEREPERLVAEAGLDREDADLLARRWQEGRGLSELVRLVEPAKVPYEVVRVLHARLGSEAARLVREDPFILLDVERASFAQADGLATSLGIGPLDDRRLAAGARAALAAARRRDGHQYLTREQVAQRAAQVLKLDPVAGSAGVTVAVDRGLLAEEVVATSDGPVTAISTPGGMRAERNLAEDLERLLSAPRPRLRPFAEALEITTELTEGQRDAVRLAFTSPVSILTGGPGTGKTRTLQEIVVAAEAAGIDLALCAPTGRAAKRIEEVVGRPATTVHRMLEARPTETGGFIFRFGRDEPLPFDLIVCDEVSMCDTWLASRLVAAVEDGAHLVLVGDPDQLPPVGPGDVLRDVLRCGVLPVTVLTEVHRQAAASRIVGLAREVNEGTLAPMKGADGDVFLAQSDRRWVVARVVEAVTNRAPAYFDVSVEDVQVVAPVYRGEAGVDALNAGLKEAINPGDGRVAVSGFNEGDRVMQTRNDAELDVSNGDIGHVVDVARRKRELRVRFPRGEVTYDLEQARHLTLAWAVTVHKSQGGEWPVVVFVCDRSHRAMLWRNLAYTAITRAARALIIVGQEAALRSAAGHDVPRNRQTLLGARLQLLVGSASTTSCDQEHRAR